MIRTRTFHIRSDDALVCCPDEQECRGFSLIELVVIMAIIATLAAIAIPTYVEFIYRAKIVKAVSDIESISKAVSVCGIDSAIYPMSLEDVCDENFLQVLDPWGNAYQYVNIINTGEMAHLRRDKFLVPLNTDFDLYSMGKDGESQPPLTVNVSQDDILRANNGSFIGRAIDY